MRSLDRKTKAAKEACCLLDYITHAVNTEPEGIKWLDNRIFELRWWPPNEMPDLAPKNETEEKLKAIFDLVKHGYVFYCMQKAKTSDHAEKSIKELILSDRRYFDKVIKQAAEAFEEGIDEYLTPEYRDVFLGYSTGKIKRPPKRRGRPREEKKAVRLAALLIVAKSCGLNWYKNYSPTSDGVEHHLNAVNIVASYVARVKSQSATNENTVKDGLKLARAIYKNIKRDSM